MQRVGDSPALRTTIRLAYRGRAWASVQLEVAPVEGDLGREIDRVPARSLEHLGLEGPDDVPCVALRWQIAQKLHACTEPPAEGRRNDRLRDLADLLLLWDLVQTAERTAVRVACTEIFALRATHPWPPHLVVFEHWEEPYRVLASAIRFPIVDVDEAARAVQVIVDELAKL
jgi:hypothetical protein